MSSCYIGQSALNSYLNKLSACCETLRFTIVNTLKLPIQSAGNWTGNASSRARALFGGKDVMDACAFRGLGRSWRKRKSILHHLVERFLVILLQKLWFKQIETWWAYKLYTRICLQGMQCLHHKGFYSNLAYLCWPLKGWLGWRKVSCHIWVIDIHIQ